MLHTTLPSHDIYAHVRPMLGMVIGLGVTRLLSGVVRMAQQPRAHALSTLHLAWVASVLLSLVHFWWWQYGLWTLPHWTFGTYAFVLFYAVLLFMQCAYLFPDQLPAHESHEAFFLRRRKGFFVLLAITSLIDIVDTLIKGAEHFARFGLEYLVRTPVLLVVYAVAATTSSHRLQIMLALGTLIYQISWIFRFFDTPT